MVYNVIRMLRCRKKKITTDYMDVINNDNKSLIAIRVNI